MPLIDGCESPLTDNFEQFEQIDVAKSNQTMLNNFYGTLKELDEQLRFVFATGVTKFSKGSLFFGLHNLTDITLEQADLAVRRRASKTFLCDQVKKLAQERCPGGTAAASEQSLAEMEKSYAGYRFSKERRVRL